MDGDTTRDGLTTDELRERLALAEELTAALERAADAADALAMPLGSAVKKAEALALALERAAAAGERIDARREAGILAGAVASAEDLPGPPGKVMPALADDPEGNDFEAERHRCVEAWLAEVRSQ